LISRAEVLLGSVLGRREAEAVSGTPQAPNDTPRIGIQGCISAWNQTGRSRCQTLGTRARHHRLAVWWVGVVVVKGLRGLGGPVRCGAGRNLVDPDEPVTSRAFPKKPCPGVKGRHERVGVAWRARAREGRPGAVEVEPAERLLRFEFPGVLDSGGRFRRAPRGTGMSARFKLDSGGRFGGPGGSGGIVAN
jgi:hypothetical protein